MQGWSGEWADGGNRAEGMRGGEQEEEAGEGGEDLAADIHQGWGRGLSVGAGSGLLLA